MSKPQIDFRSTAVDLAEQLQAANVSIVQLVDALEHSVDTIALLKKHMTPNQLLFARLEMSAIQRSEMRHAWARQKQANKTTKKD